MVDYCAMPPCDPRTESAAQALLPWSRPHRETSTRGQHWVLMPCRSMAYKQAGPFQTRWILTPIFHLLSLTAARNPLFILQRTALKSHISLKAFPEGNSLFRQPFLPTPKSDYMGGRVLCICGITHTCFLATCALY